MLKTAPESLYAYCGVKSVLLLSAYSNSRMITVSRYVIK